MSTLDIPTAPDPLAAPPLRWGILGAGGIARRFAREVPTHSSGQVVAVGSRDTGRTRAAAFAKRHGIERSHASYEELVADDGVEAVYVATPHSEHRAHALLAIEAGKHVLVEKAFTRNAAEASGVLAWIADSINAEPTTDSRQTNSPMPILRSGDSFQTLLIPGYTQKLKIGIRSRIRSGFAACSCDDRTSNSTSTPQCLTRQNPNWMARPSVSYMSTASLCEVQHGGMARPART